MNVLGDKYKKLPIQAKASLWFLVCAFFQKGIAFISTPIFTRILSTDEYGQYNVFISWKNVVSVIVTLNLFAGVYIRGLVKYSEEKRVFSSSLQGLTLTLVGIWSLIYFGFHNFFNQLFNLNSLQMLLMLLTIWTSSVFAFWSMEQRVDNKYRMLVAITVIVTILKPIVSITLIGLADDKATARILGVSIVEVVFFVGMFAAQMKRGRVFFEKRFWKHALAFNIPLIPHYLSTSVLNSADCIMVKRMVGESAAGIYSLAYSVSMIMTVFNTALIQTIEPWLYKKINEKKIEDISRVAYPSFLIVATVNLVLIAIAPEVVRVFAPIEYYDAIYVIPPVAMSVFFMFSYIFFAVFEFYYEKTKLVTLGTTVGALLNIVMNYFFINRYGYIAAGYTTLICYMAYAGFHFCFMYLICKRKFDGIQPYSIKVYFLITGLFLACGFILLKCYENFLARICFISIVTIVVILFRKKLLLLYKQIIGDL